MVSASIEGLTQLGGANLTNPGRSALFGERLDSGESLLLGQHTSEKDPEDKKATTVQGQAYLVGALIGGVLQMSHSTFLAPKDGVSVNADSAVITRNFSLLNSYVAGVVHGRSCSVRGTVRFKDAELAAPLNSEVHDLSNMQASELDIRAQGSVLARINLNSAVVQRLVDRADVWPVDVELSGFRYDVIEETAETQVSSGEAAKAEINGTDDSSNPNGLTLAPRTAPSNSAAADADAADTTLNNAKESADPVGHRIRWLVARVHPYRPDPFDQLASVYRRQGDEEAAIRVAIARENARTAAISWRRPHSKAWRLLLRFTVLYGYRPAGALFYLVLLWLVGAVALSLSAVRPVGDEHRPSVPALLVLDLLLPVVDLGEEDHYVLDGVARPIGWLLVLSGWILTTVVVAGFTKFFDRRR